MTELMNDRSQIVVCPLSAKDICLALELASQGTKTVKIAAALGCSVSTLHWHERNNPDFDIAMRQARTEGWLALGESLLTIVEDHPYWDIQDVKLQSENMRWVLSRFHPTVFGDKLAVTVERVDVLGAIKEAKARVAHIVNPVTIESTAEEVIDPFS